MLQEAIQFFPTRMVLSLKEARDLHKGYSYRKKIKVMYNDYLAMQKIRTDNMHFWGYAGRDQFTMDLFLLGFGTSLKDIERGCENKWAEIEVMFVFVKK